jgi:hypothetical protein
VHVAGPQLRCQTVALAVEQQQRVIASGFEVAVVGALLLFAVNLLNIPLPLRTAYNLNPAHSTLRRGHRMPY